MIVQVKQGSLEGGKRPSILTGKEYFHFSGIPYAEPPLGDLRFRPPVPVTKWEGVRNAQKEGDCCKQCDFNTPDVMGSEDCLYLNVYTPEAPNPSGPPKAVMVYIHGGGYIAGSGGTHMASPDYLMGHDIILVTFNYRLHVLGFLNLNIPSCPGNCGMKDQSLALKWVHENIRSFGGDPNNITIFGESAGGSSVHLQMISPMSKGLFKRAIMQSGNALAPWAITEDPEDKGFRIGKKLGFDGTDPEKLVEFLKKQPLEELHAAVKKVTDDRKLEHAYSCQGLSFTPSVETITENAFLPDHPRNLLKTADPMPIMSGVDEKEGVIVFFGAQDPRFAEKALENMSQVLKNNTPCDPAKVPELAAKVKEFYFKCAPSKFRDQFVNMYSDLFFLHMYDSVDYIIKSKHSAYFYEFAFGGDLNQSSKWMSAGKDPVKATTASHADELGYIFYSTKFFPKPEFKEPEKTMIKYMTTLWTNFAKTGNPTPNPSQLGVEWKPHTEENPAYLKINQNMKLFEERIWNDRRAFWTDALKKLARAVPK